MKTFIYKAKSVFPLDSLQKKSYNRGTIERRIISYGRKIHLIEM